MTAVRWLLLEACQLAGAGSLALWVLADNVAARASLAACIMFFALSATTGTILKGLTRG